MAMALQSPALHLDSLSNGLRGLSLSSLPPAQQASPKTGTNIRMAIKRWERKEVKENSLPVVLKLHVKIGDTVKVISGHDKGKVSTVTQLYTHNGKVVLKDVNLKTKHVKGKAEGETGQIVQVEAPIHSSNVMLYSKSAKVASRVGHKTLDDGKRVRYLVKTGEVLDSAEEWKKVHKKKNDEKKSRHSNSLSDHTLRVEECAQKERVVGRYSIHNVVLLQHIRVGFLIIL